MIYILFLFTSMAMLVAEMTDERDMTGYISRFHALKVASTLDNTSLQLELLHKGQQKWKSMEWETYSIIFHLFPNYFDGR